MIFAFKSPRLSMKTFLTKRKNAITVSANIATGNIAADCSTLTLPKNTAIL